MRPGWDIFCRVVDHFGDAGVCWRLARQLAQEFALDVRLWIDAPQTLQRLAPDALPGTRVHGVAVERWDDAAPPADAAQVVIGAFQCLPPAPYRESMRTRRSCWINLEHLSAEAWVEAHHGLPSPKPDGLVEHFFFPGFTESTGGLLRERQLLVERDRFQSDPQAPRRWLAAQRVQPAPDETLVSLFCYPDAPVAPLLDALAARPQRSRVLVPQGVADAALAAWANSPLAPGDARRAGQVTLQRIAFLPQPQYDRLLWCCDLNFVRGEDSFVRALWAGRPFVWNAYRQPQRAHWPKLSAFEDLYLAHAPAAVAQSARALFDAWNGDGELSAALPAVLAMLPELRAHHRRWVAQLTAPNLAAELVRFCAARC